MSDRIESLIEEIESHSRAVERQRVRWEEFYAGKRRRMVMADMGYRQAPFEMPRLLRLPDAGRYSRLEVLQNPDRYLEWQLECIAHHLSLELEDDWMPALWPWYGVGVLQSAFGCRVEWQEESDPWAHTRFRTMVEAEDLRKPHLKKAGLCRTVLETLDRWQELTRGRLPIRFTDVQSPLDVATQIVDYGEVLTAMISNPRAVHRLMVLVTETLIDWVRLQTKQIENVWPGGWHYRIEEGKGIGVSDDALVVLSPSQYEEFVSPYCAAISEAFGGIFIHYCPSPVEGNPMHNLEMMQRIPSLRGIETRFAKEDLATADRLISRDVILMADRWEMPLSDLLAGFPERRMIVNLFEEVDGPEGAGKMKEMIETVRAGE